jgi:uncharacterized protein YajQ (UPF0234 family)
MPSFDIVSKLDPQELDNALNQARKEIAQRFDFKGTGTEIDQGDAGIVLRSESEGRVEAAWDVLAGKLVRRGLPLEAFTRGKIEPAGGKTQRQTVTTQEGIPQDAARKILKLLKDQKLKVQASIQGDTVRVSGKKRDDLQAAIQAVKGADLGVAMQFVNFRD